MTMHRDFEAVIDLKVVQHQDLRLVRSQADDD
jgi:hypothetical protein